MFFVVKPLLAREIQRQFEFTERQDGEQQDYSINNTSMEVPLKQAYFIEGSGDVVKAKAGDVLTLVPSVEILVKNRIIMVEAHDKLYDYGIPTFKKIYRHGDVAPTFVTWQCTHDLDLKSLPYLLEIYVVNEHVK